MKRVWVLILCTVLGVQCAVAQRKASDERESVTFERLVDVGDGRRLFIQCTGKARAGMPIVVLDAGMGNTSDTWSLVQPKVSQFARVCSYDRAGLGKSDRGPQPRTSHDMVNDLHNLLANAGIKPPYVLAGHSFGGMNVRLFASEHAKDVVGMVLVDSTHEDENDRMLAVQPPEIVKNARPEDMVIRGPEDIDFNKSMAQVRAANWRRDIPLIVLTRGSANFNPNDYAIPSLAPKFEEIRLELQKELVRRSSRGKQIVADKSGHFIQRDQPELVVDAIREVMEPAVTAQTSQQRVTNVRVAMPDQQIYGPLFVTIAGTEKKVTDEAQQAWIINGGRHVVYSSSDGAGGYENEGQSLYLYDVNTGKHKQILSEYFAVQTVEEVITSTRKRALLVTMADGGLGASYVAVVDPARGQVFFRRWARILSHKGDTIVLGFYREEDWGLEVASGGKMRPYKRERHNLKSLLRRPVIVNKKDNRLGEGG